MQETPQVQYAPGITNVIISQQPTLTNDPTQIYCPTCCKNVISEVGYENGTCTWVACCAILLLGGAFFCCLIPFCCNGCKDAEHKCPDCHNVIGIYRRL